MTNTNLKKKLSILVHWQSCKPNGFWSDTFKEALANKFKNEYELTLFDGKSNDGFYSNGTTGFILDNPNDGEANKIIEWIKNVFDNLKEKHKNGNYEWLNATKNTQPQII